MRIAITTSGGDAPGLNAVIRAATTTGVRLGHEMYGISHGFDGLLEKRGLARLTHQGVEGIEREGGTVLGAASGGSPLQDDGASQIAAMLREYEVDALLAAGGDGTMRIAHAVAREGIQVVGLPKTIDRDLVATDETFGFNTATFVATEALDRLHTTIASHKRLMVVEVMGRDSGWIALHAGIAGGAHMIAIPELPYSVEAFVAHIRGREQRGHQHHLVVCAEGAHPVGGEIVRDPRTGKYGGVAEQLAAELEEATGHATRSLVLGHLQRGGRPTTYDRVLGMQLGSMAVRTLDRGETDVMMAVCGDTFETVPLEEVVGRIRRVPADSPLLETTRNLGIHLGQPRDS